MVRQHGMQHEGGGLPLVLTAAAFSTHPAAAALTLQQQQKQEQQQQGGQQLNINRKSNDSPQQVPQ